MAVLSFFFFFFFEQFYGDIKVRFPNLTPDGGSRVPVSNTEKRGAQGSSVSLPVIIKQFGVPTILPLAEYEAPGFRACGAMTFGGVVRGRLEDRHIV
ncbi:hypothetical protein IAS59_005812 [Cryptococcus gattii]